MVKAYVNSRGDEEERIMAIANYLHSEEHLTEAMTKDPDKVEELTEQLDKVRDSRQKLVRTWSDGKANSNHWCNCKHQISNCYHLHELITNAARDNPEYVPELAEQLASCIEERDKAVQLFMSGDGKDMGAGSCQRCSADLGLEDGVPVFKTYVEKEDTKQKGFISSDLEDNAVWIILGLLLVSVAIMSKTQAQTARR